MRAKSAGSADDSKRMRMFLSSKTVPKVFSKTGSESNHQTGPIVSSKDDYIHLVWLSRGQ